MPGSNEPGGKVPVPNTSTLVGDIIGLTQLLGGQRQTVTKSPGDVAALQKLIADATAMDYSSQLESVFNKAQGAIPQIYAGYGRTMGRSYGNSQIQAALGELLKQTTLTGAKQVAELELQNRQLATNAASALAQATTGTSQTSTTKTPLAPAAGALLLLQALGSLKGNQQGDVFESMGNAVKNIFSPAGSSGAGAVSGTAPIVPTPAIAPTAAVAPAAASAATSTPAQNFGLGDLMTAITTPVQAGINAVGQFLEAPVSTAADIITAPFQLVNQGYDWVSDQANDVTEWVKKNLLGG